MRKEERQTTKTLVEELRELYFERCVESDEYEEFAGKTYRELYPFGNDTLDQEIEWMLEANGYALTNEDEEYEEGYTVLSEEEENELWWEIYNYRFPESENYEIDEFFESIKKYRDVEFYESV